MSTRVTRRSAAGRQSGGVEEAVEAVESPPPKKQQQQKQQPQKEKEKEVEKPTGRALRSGRATRQSAASVDSHLEEEHAEEVTPPQPSPTKRTTRNKSPIVAPVDDESTPVAAAEDKRQTRTKRKTDPTAPIIPASSNTLETKKMALIDKQVTESALENVATSANAQPPAKKMARSNDIEEAAHMSTDALLASHHGPMITTSTAPSGRITVEAPSIPREAPFVETPLPGIADEVESYPCKFCPERVFLTSFGLERHTKMNHPENLEEILEDITRIQEEWKRRETEREKQRERLALAKIRQEALAAAAAREALQHSDVVGAGQYVVRGGPAVMRKPGGGVAGAGWVKAAGNSNAAAYYPGADVPGLGQSNFESCRICGLLINAEHPTAMENHMRAHKKNDELRTHLLNTYGPEFVARVTCHECQLVFTDERKLISHAEAMHVRRRKYVCKWCGHVCLTMTDLNNHKADVHGMPVSRSRDPETRRQRQLAALTKGKTHTHSLFKTLQLRTRIQIRIRTF